LYLVAGLCGRFILNVTAAIVWDIHHKNGQALKVGLHCTFLVGGNILSISTGNAAFSLDKCEALCFDDTRCTHGMLQYTGECFTRVISIHQPVIERIHKGVSFCSTYKV